MKMTDLNQINPGDMNDSEFEKFANMPYPNIEPNLFEEAGILLNNAEVGVIHEIDPELAQAMGFDPNDENAIEYSDIQDSLPFTA